MTVSPKRNVRAFTIVELLVVIGIIAVVAGLVVGLGAVAGEKSKISRAQAERDRLVTLIEAYKAKVGVYPPDNTNNPAHNALLYELAGCIRDGAPDPDYISPFGNVRASVLDSGFNAKGIVNAVDIGGETNQLHRLLKDVKPDQTNAVVSGTFSFVVPIDDPNGQRPNPWKYLAGDHASHNPASFDLWVDIKVRGKVRTIGNWKD